MIIRVKLFTRLADYVPGVKSGEPFEVEVKNGATMADLIDQLKLPGKEAKLLFANGLAKSPDYLLKNNDEVGIFPPIGGG
jgi:molybdopterin synthase sulfur carrier subunit